MQIEDFMQFNFKRYRLPLITVYKYPSDFPESFVARLFDVDISQDVFILKDSLEDIRDAIPKRFYRIERHPTDDPVIVEVWV